MTSMKATAATDEANPLGLQCIWSSTKSLDTRFNLVLVHGHTGDAFSTWKHGNGRSWPKEFLPSENNMRNIVVWTWGYRAVEEQPKCGEFIVPSTIFGLGERLCGELHDHQVQDHPITFLGHGIGGIIIKSALNHSKVTSSMSKILDNTRHVIFLDTPHMGIGIEALQTLNGGHLSDHVARQYGLWSQELEAQAKRFSNIAESFNISSACASILNSEGYMSAQIAQGHSAHTLVPHERIFYMDRVRHDDICRFPNAEHVNYRRLRDRIRIGLSGVRQDDKRIPALREWIGNVDSCSQDEHRENCNIIRKHEGTCDWLFKDATFQRWADESKSHACLWLTGPSGVGKTFLSSAAMEYVQTMPDGPGTAFEFIHFGTAFQKLEILRRLASSLLDRVIDCDVLTETAIGFKNRARNNTEEMKALISELLRAAAAVGRIFIFIDGINEVASKMSYDKDHKQLEKEENDAKDFIGFLFRCGLDEPSVRLWFSSQSDDRTIGWLKQEIHARDGTVGKVSIHELSIPETESCASVSKFLKAAIETHVNLKNVGESDLLVLPISRMYIKSMAADSFRWAAMMAEAIKECSSIDEIKKTLLKDPPADLSYLYRMSLQRQQNMDARDHRKRSCTGYSRAILSILTFARRPLRFTELQEAITSFCLDEQSTSTGLPNISPGSLILFDRLKNRCVPFVRYYSKGDDDTDGVFRLAHQSVQSFLLSVSNHPGGGSFTTTDNSGRPPMVDATFLAKSCLKYLFQCRYSQPLTKYTALTFRAGHDDVRNHKFLQYAAKYWYRHVDDPEPSSKFSELVENFVRSDHFVTAIQVQSLFVPGHFIQGLDRDDPRERMIKKNLPELLKSNDCMKLWTDYHEFLAEWGPFLQRGVAGKVNGEIDRCLWSTLSQTNHFRRHQFLQRFQMARILERESGSSENADVVLYGVTSTDELNVTVWRVRKSDTSHDDLKLFENTWALETDEPRHVSSKKFLFSRTETSWELYNPGVTRFIRLIPSLNEAERVPPIAFTSSRERIRIGSTEFAASNDGHWLKEKGNAENHGLPYWENIQVHRNLRVKSRRRLVEAKPRFRKVPFHRRQSWSTSDQTSTADESESDDSSQLSFGVESPTRSCSSASTCSQESLSLASEVEAEGSGGDGTDDESEHPKQDPSPQESESEDDMDSKTSPARSNPSRTGTQFISTHVSDSTSSESEADQSEDSSEGVTRKEHGRVDCDRCQTRDVSRFYRCDICVRGNFYDVCFGCVKKGQWCHDRFHQLYATRLTSRGLRRRLGGLRLVDCRPDTCLVVEKLDGDTHVIFRYQDLKPKRDALYNSHPRFHPSNDLMVWPLGSGDMLFVNIKENKYFIRATHGGAKRHWRHQELIVDSHFSACGRFLYTLTVSATSLIGYSYQAQPEIDIILSAWSLSSKRPSNRRPKELAKTKVDLGKWHRNRLTDQPFSLTWTKECVYLTCSSDRLCVYRLPLKTSRAFPCEQTGDISKQVTQPSEEITLPRTARCRRVQFFPGNAPELDGMVIIGPRDGEQSASPIVIYLPRGSLGAWKVVDKANDIDVSEESDRKGESQFEAFDSEDDCDLIVYDPKFRV